MFIRNEKLIDEKLLWTQLTKNNSKKIELIDADSYKGHKTKYNVSYNSLDDYRKKFQKNTSKSKFLVITNFNKFISAEIWLSDYLSKSFWLGSVNTWFFMNKKNLRVLCHNDSVNNLHHVVFGKKTFFLAPPSASLDKYVNQHFQEGFNSFNPFKEVEKAKKIGKFLVLNKNDSLYIPNGWWHSVYYNEDTIAISALDEPTHI